MKARCVPLAVRARTVRHVFGRNYLKILLVCFDGLLMEPCAQGDVLADGSRAEELETKRHGIRAKQVTRSRRETAANSDAESVESEAALDRAIEQCDMESSRSAYFVIGM